MYIHQYLALIYIHLNKLTIAITGKKYYALNWHDSQLNSSYESSRYRRPFLLLPHATSAGQDADQGRNSSASLGKMCVQGRAWSIGLNLISYTVKKFTSWAQNQTSRLTEKRLIFRPTDSLVLRLPLWLMEFLMRSTSFFTVYSNPGLGRGHPNKGGLRTFSKALFMYNCSPAHLIPALNCKNFFIKDRA